MPEVAGPPTGTRPEGAQTEVEAGRKVREMFTAIAPRYDLLNHLLSLQLDRIWRAQTAKRLQRVFAECGAQSGVASQVRVLDLCCGTGDLGIAVNRRYRSARVVGVDFSHRMLLRARKKSDRQHGPDLLQLRPMKFIEADALQLPFADDLFNLVVTGFGFRNLANYEAGLQEIRRVLKPGGTLAILEFTEPPPGALGALYRWYCRKLLPQIGGLISGNQNAYKYLPASVSRFFRPDELSTLLSNAGFDSVHVELWTLGTVALHTCRRREYR
jgi:demethylmenaquinone methyltransferase / 2-methoxy-6-polyprenyl-1,4-benzoquinol methylase